MNTNTLFALFFNTRNALVGLASASVLSLLVAMPTHAQQTQTGPGPINTPDPASISLAAVAVTPAAGGTATLSVSSSDPFQRSESVAVVISNARGASVTYPGINRDNITQNFTRRITSHGKQTVFVRVAKDDTNGNFTIQVPNDADAPDILVQIVERGNFYDLGANTQRVVTIGDANLPVVTLTRMGDRDAVVARGGKITYLLTTTTALTSDLDVNLEVIGAVDRVNHFRPTGGQGDAFFGIPAFRTNQPLPTRITTGNSSMSLVLTTTASGSDVPDYGRLILKPGTGYVVGNPQTARFRVVERPTVYVSPPNMDRVRRNAIELESGKNHTFTLHSTTPAPTANLSVRMSVTGSATTAVYTPVGNTTGADRSAFDVVIPAGHNSTEFTIQTDTSPPSSSTLVIETNRSGANYDVIEANNLAFRSYRVPEVQFGNGISTAANERARISIPLRLAGGASFPEDTNVTLRVSGAVGTITYPVDLDIFPYSPYTEAREHRNTESQYYPVFFRAGTSSAQVTIYASGAITTAVQAEIIPQDGLYTSGNSTHSVTITTDGAPNVNSQIPLTVEIGEETILENRRVIPFTITRGSGGDDTSQMLRYRLRLRNNALAGGNNSLGRVRLARVHAPGAGIIHADPPASRTTTGAAKTYDAIHPVGTNSVVHGTITIGRDSYDTESSNLTLQLFRPTQFISTSTPAISEDSIIIGDIDPVITVMPQNRAATFYVNQNFMRSYGIRDAIGTPSLFTETAQRALPAINANPGSSVPITFFASSNQTRRDTDVVITYDDPDNVLASGHISTVVIPPGHNETTINVPIASGASGIVAVQIAPSNIGLATSGGEIASPEYTIGHQNTTLIIVGQNIGDPVVTLAGSSTAQESGTVAFTINTGGIRSLNNITVPVTISTANTNGLARFIANGDARSIVGDPLPGRPGHDFFTLNVPIEAGQTEGTFSFATVNAVLNSTISVHLNEGFGYTLAGGFNSPQASRLLTVRDLGIMLASPGPVNEGSPIEFTLELFPAQTTAVTATYSTADGSSGAAMAGVDYRAVSGGRVTFAPGETTKTISVATIDNNVYRAGTNAAFTINAEAVVAGVTSTTSATGVIVDNNDPPVVSLIGSSSVQPNGTARFTLRTDGTVSVNDIDVPVTISGMTDQIDEFMVGGSAVSGVGVGSPPSYPLTIPIAAGETENTFGFTTINGVENETINVALDAVSDPTTAGYALATQSSRVVTIRDIGISLIAVNAPVAEGSAAEFTLELFPEQTEAVTAIYSTADDTGVAGRDFRAVSGASVRFAPGETMKTISVATINNNVHRGASGDASFMINAEAEIQGNQVQTSASVDITDDEDAPVVRVASPSRIGPGRNGTMSILTNGVVSASSHTIMVNLNGSFDFAYNGSHVFDGPTNTSTPIVVQQVNNNVTVSVTLAALANRATFQVQASEERDNVTLHPISASLAAGQGTMDTFMVTQIASQQVATAQVRAGFASRLLTEAILPQATISVIDEVTSAISSRTHRAFGDSSDGGWLPPFPRGEGNNSGAGYAGSGDAGSAGSLTIDGQSLADYALSFAQREASREASENPWDAPDAGSRQLTELPSATSLAFVLPLRAGETSGTVAVWGQGFNRNVDGNAEGVEFDGEIPGAVFGVDARLSPNLLAGVGFSQATGDFSYAATDETGDVTRGSYEADLTGYHPYVGYRTDGGGSVWASLGIGEGEVTIAQREADLSYVGEVEYQNYGLGFNSLGDSQQEASGSIALNIHGDINFASVEETPTARTRGNFADARASSLDVGRTRVGATVSQDRDLAGGGSFRQSFNVALRYDSGDITTDGGGIELGGAVGVEAASGLSLDLSARTLLNHDEDVDEWGVSGALLWRSQAFAGGGRGLSLVVRPEWGNTESQSDALLDGGLAGVAGVGVGGVADASADDAAARYHFDVRYGLALFRDGLLTPYVSGDAGDAESTLYGSAFSFGGFAAGVESASDEDNAFIRYEREF